MTDYSKTRASLAVMLGVGMGYVERIYTDEYIHQMLTVGEAQGLPVTAEWMSQNIGTCARCGRQPHLRPDELSTASEIINAVYYRNPGSNDSDPLGRRAAATDDHIEHASMMLERIGAISRDRCVAVELMAATA